MDAPNLQVVVECTGTQPSISTDKIEMDRMSQQSSRDENRSNSCVSEDDRLLLEKLAIENPSSQPVLLLPNQTNRSKHTEYLHLDLDRQTASVPHTFLSNFKVQKSMSAPNVESATLSKPTVLRKNSSSDNITLKSALSQRTSPRSDTRKTVSFVDISTEDSNNKAGTVLTVEHQAERQADPANEDKVKKLQQELDEMKHKLSGLQKPSGVDVSTELPQVTDDMSITELLGVVSKKLKLSTEVVKQDFEIMNKARIYQVGHLRLLMENKDLWKEFELPLLEKCVLEQLLGKSSDGGWLWVGLATIVPVALTGLFFNNSAVSKFLKLFEDILDL